MIRQYSPKEILIRTHLQMAVPLKIFDLKESGGPLPDHFEKIRGWADYFAEKGDIFLFRGEKKGEAAHYMNRLVEAIAVCAFLPGGIEIFDLKFQVYPITYDRPWKSKYLRPAKKKRRKR